jgi:site-specific DNA-methyltransferase (adenine-specific)
MGYHYRARYEFILFFEKGKRRLNDLGIADIITAPRIHGGYPAEKPVAVSEVLVRQSSEPGQLIADPFMGSGSVGVAALRLGRRFAGTDLNPQAVRVAADKLREFGPGREPDGLPPASQPGLLELSDSPEIPEPTL